MATTPPQGRVGVVGASTRAAVHSLARAGHAAWASDLFADRDLARVAPCAACPADGYPDRLIDLADGFPAGPVLFTGGLENYPAVVQRLAATRELWGNPPAVLAATRDPYHVFAVLAAAGFKAPVLTSRTDGCPATGRWVRKPFRSAGGLGMRLANPGEPPADTHYFQEFVDGVALSAVYVDAELFGVTRQLAGESWLHARPFAYAGNIAVADDDFREAFARLGRFGHAEFRLRGVWNIDCVAADGELYVLEFNPRYSASVEVIEHTSGRAVWSEASAARPTHVVGKAVYYAHFDLTFPAAGPWDADLADAFDPWRLPAYADIPHADSQIAGGQPVLTVFASGSDTRECCEALQSRAAELDALFAGVTP